MAPRLAPARAVMALEDAAAMPLSRTHVHAASSSRSLVFIRVYDTRMAHRRALQVGALVWAAVGLFVALSSLGAVMPDARAVVALASGGGPLAAVLAAVAFERRRDRVAGVL